MREPPFFAKDMSVEARTFLYACAFWAVAADQKLRTAEQAWLVEQFGQEGATQSLEEFVALESGEFFTAFDSAAAALSDEERRVIYLGLEAWLLSCAEADGAAADEEKQIIEKIKARLSLDRKIARLTGAPAPAAPPQAAATPETVGEGETGTLTGHDSEINAVCLSPDGRAVLSGDEAGVVKVWDFGGGSEMGSFDLHEMGVMDVCFCPDGRSAVSGDRMGLLKRWDVESGNVIWSKSERGRGGVTAIDVSPDGKSVAASSDIGMVVVRDLENGDPVCEFGERRRGCVRCVCFSPAGSPVAFGGDDRTVRLWDAKTRAETTTFEGHGDGVMTVCFSPDGRTVVSGSRDNTLRLWEVESGKELQLFEGHTFTVYSACFSPDGRHILSGAWDHTVKLWDAKSARQIFNLESVDARFSGIAFHPDGRHVVAGGSDNAIHVVCVAGA